MSVSITFGEMSHTSALLRLYREVAEVPDGIIREPEEITKEFIEDTTRSAINHGLIMVALQKNHVVGEIHAVTPGLKAFKHLLTNLTIVVSPTHQGRGIGKKLFTCFLDHVKTQMPHILRVELFTREHIQQNLNFYQSLGFVNEGRQHQKIVNLNGGFHTPVHMAWFNPFFKHH